jgi:hypothetical protein
VGRAFAAVVLPLGEIVTVTHAIGARGGARHAMPGPDKVSGSLRRLRGKFLDATAGAFPAPWEV